MKKFYAAHLVGNNPQCIDRLLCFSSLKSRNKYVKDNDNTVKIGSKLAKIELKFHIAELL